jgi:hypothetical protein
MKFFFDDKCIKVCLHEYLMKSCRATSCNQIRSNPICVSPFVQHCVTWFQCRYSFMYRDVSFFPQEGM